MKVFYGIVNKMRGLIIGAALSVSCSIAGAVELYAKLAAIDGVVSVEELSSGPFMERYVVMFVQPLDHGDHSEGKFNQRVIVAHAGFDHPTLLITDGYSSYWGMTTYRDEISYHFNTNQIIVEHRYFGESLPETPDWSYLTSRNAAGDLHRIRQALSSTYPGKWIAAGVSKGGQNALTYNAFYPQDVSAAVAFVTPVCFGVEDGRHETFLEQVGSAAERTAVLEFQLEILARKERLMPLFEKYCNARNYQYRIPLTEAYDFCVLEYAFAFWQWGMDAGAVPSPGSSDESLFHYFVTASPPDYFTVANYPPFFVQAARELGYYGYDVAPFEGMMTVKSAKNYLRRILLPEEMRQLKFDKKLSLRLIDYLKHNDPRIIFLYGEFDPWSAAAVDPSLFSGKENMKLYVEPRGNHDVRINALPEKMRQEIWETLEKWIFQ